MRVLLTGASGFLGRALAPALLAAGHDVRGVSRSPEAHTGDHGGRVEWVEADLEDAGRLRAVVEGCDAAYYLVHSLEGDDADGFAERDRALADTFADAVGPERRVVYQGALEPEPGAETSSAHLDSRLQVGRLLRERCDAVELRAAVVIGAGGASYEMSAGLARRLPLIVAPRWASTPTQPVALDDAVAYLVAALHLPAGAYDVAGPDRLTYVEMLEVLADEAGHPRRSVTVPGISRDLSAAAVAWLTGQERGLVGPLVHGLAVPVLADTTRIRELVPQVEPVGYREAVRRALEVGAREPVP